MNYYAVARTSNIWFSESSIKTTNSVASIPLSLFGGAYTYNIRAKDLKSSFHAEEEYLLFKNESDAIQFYEENTPFAGTATHHYETVAIFQVEFNKTAPAMDEEAKYFSVNKSDLELLSGKLLKLSHSNNITENYLDLQNIDDKEIAHSARFVWA